MKVEDYLGPEVEYDKYGGTFIWSKKPKDGIEMIADVRLRGWGNIQHLFENLSDAEDFQDKVGEFVAQAINEKLNRIKHPPTVLIPISDGVVETAYYNHEVDIIITDDDTEGSDPFEEPRLVKIHLPEDPKPSIQYAYIGPEKKEVTNLELLRIDIDRKVKENDQKNS